MKSLESMANELFVQFSIKETGKRSNWKYLSNERKLAWMQDVLFISKYFIENLQQTMKPIPNNMKSSTVYETGFNEGVRSERTSLTVMLEDINNDLINEYEEFKFISSKIKKL